MTPRRSALKLAAAAIATKLAPRPLAAGALPVAALPATTGRPAPHAAADHEADLVMGRIIPGFGALSLNDGENEHTISGDIRVRRIDRTWFVVLSPEMRARLDAIEEAGPPPERVPVEPFAWPAALAGGEGEIILVTVPHDERPMMAARMALKRHPGGAWTATNTGLYGPAGRECMLPPGATADAALAWLFEVVEDTFEACR